MSTAHDIICQFRSRIEDGQVSMRSFEIRSAIVDNIKATRNLDFSMVDFQVN